MTEREARFKEVQIWFTVLADLASAEDGSFCIVMSPDEAIKYLQSLQEEQDERKDVSSDEQ